MVTGYFSHLRKRREQQRLIRARAQYFNLSGFQVFSQEARRRMGKSLLEKLMERMMSDEANRSV